MKKRFICSFMIICFLFLTGCTDSLVIEKAKDTREIIQERVYNNKNNNKKIDSESANQKDYEYTRSYSPEDKKLQAPDGTKLIGGNVVYTVDGDTADIQLDNGKKERVRFILIDTPESKGKYENNPEPFAIEAYEFTKGLIQDKNVWLEIDKGERDQYGRLLAYIWLDGVVLNQKTVSTGEEKANIREDIGTVTLNELLLREGLAKVVVFPPNVKYQKHFENVQEQAKNEKKGMWQ